MFDGAAISARDEAKTTCCYGNVLPDDRAQPGIIRKEDGSAASCTHLPATRSSTARSLNVASSTRSDRSIDDFMFYVSNGDV